MSRRGGSGWTPARRRGSRSSPGAVAPSRPTLRVIHEKLAPLDLALRDDAPERVNLLIPTIDLEHFFGGYIGKLNLARRLAERGVRVRIVTVDPVGPLPPTWRQTVEAYSGLAGLFDSVEVAFGREIARGRGEPHRPLRRHHLVDGAPRATGARRARRRALPLPDPGVRAVHLRDGEPRRAGAASRTRFPHHALFSTELLRDWFRSRGLGVYADGAEAGDAASDAFQNAITDVRPPPAERAGAARRTRRLLFYARPEEHAARNMFELGALALSRALEQGVLRGGWELLRDRHGRRRPRRSSSAAAPHFSSCRAETSRGYADLLREHDVGLALMYTPHPSLAPIEMAAAGMLTVTNTLRDQDGRGSRRDLTEPDRGRSRTSTGSWRGCAKRSAGADDAERRVRGAQVNWSRDWDESFDDALMTAPRELPQTLSRGSELLGDARRLALEDPHRQHADPHVDRDGHEQQRPAAGRLDRARGARIDHPRARQLEQRRERVEQQDVLQRLAATTSSGYRTGVA